MFRVFLSFSSVLIALAFTSGCSHDVAPKTWYTDSDRKSNLAVYIDYRYHHQASAKVLKLPEKPAIACAPGYDCKYSGTILKRLIQEQVGKAFVPFSRVGEMAEVGASDPDFIPEFGPGGAMLQHDFSTPRFEELCTGAVAQGYDVVIVSDGQCAASFDASTGQGKTVSLSIYGGIIDARSKMVIAPIRIAYGLDHLSVSAVETAPSANAPTEDEVAEQFANQVIRVVKAYRSPPATVPTTTLH